VTSRLRFIVLGPMTVLRDGEPVALAGKPRTLLATLLLRAGQPVPLGVLADRVWGENPPVNTRAAVQTYVTRLRTALEDDGRLVRTSQDGYLVQVDREQFDLLEFRALVAEADALAGGDDTTEAALLHQALDLWGDAPLSDLDSEGLHRQDVPALIETRMSVLERRIEADLRLGLHARLVPELRALTAEHPLREGIWAQLIVALYRCGRQADALAAYQSVRRTLADELGIDPGPELRELQQAVLVGDVRLAPPPEQEQEPRQVWSVHNQLPLEVPHFTGRDELISRVEKALTDPAGGVPIVAVSGPPGVGKSALAIHVAHRIRSLFPDGQWYVHLAGASEQPRDPEVVLAELLVSSGVSRSELPDGLDARSALLRSRLAGRQVLVVLDDAARVDQVRPFLPGAPSSAVLVTSRAALGGLTALAGAHRLVVGQLEPDESALLLARLLRDHSVDGDEAGELADLCGHLPLALRIAASNFAIRADLELSRYLEDLRDGDRLAHLAVAGDPDAAVRNAFDTSYRALEAGSARMFRLLGLVPGRDFTVETAAALAESSYGDAQRQLELLVEANLVQRYRPGRFQHHDLLRIYASEHAKLDPGRDAARVRVLGFYLRKTAAAVQVFAPHKLRMPLREPIDDSADLDVAQALDWLDAERPNLVAAVLDAEANGPLEQAWFLADQLTSYFTDRGHLADWQLVVDAGLRAAERAGATLATGAMQRARAMTLLHGGHTAAVRQALLGALLLYRAAGDVRGEISVLNHLGIAEADSGDAIAGVKWLRQSADTARRTGDQRQLAMASSNMAVALHQSGKLEEALAAASEARTQYEALGEGPGENASLHVTATVYQDLGQIDLAGSLMTIEIAAVRRLGRRPEVAMSVGALALIHRDGGDFDAAERAAREALGVAREVGAVRTECEVQATLGTALHGLERYDEAIDRFHIALSLARHVGSLEVEVRAMLGLALARLANEQLEFAVSNAELAAQVCEPLEMAVLEGQVATALAAVYSKTGRLPEAEEAAIRAVNLLEQAGAKLHLATALTTLSTVQSARLSP